MSVYADEINNIENEMKRLRKHLKQLRGKYEFQGHQTVN